ncbi:hypothetical protein N5079_04910 [Planotetraspora sp. A-T 1434]|uniref:hypothetical protein n=1 Tax=Planotetraspora sp. A-T 1434 TaxID=2979219 RepID=UPI0021BEAD1D|nr:hypothetical protein [Planotetraspora sp. A-T 1434]MCT9929558.1 hypothetical protein [Planotetraspora sp. A-T 1434]
MTTNTTVRVEVWPVSADRAGLWLLSGSDAWRSAPIQQDRDPHSTVEAILSDHGILTDVKLLHSTSWRVDSLHATSWRAEDDSVILTYLAVIGCSDFVHENWPTATPISPAVAEAVGKAIPVDAADAPLPRYIDVLLHGLRHLRFLLYTDSSARNALCDTWRGHLAAFEPALAGMYDHERGEKPIMLPDTSALQRQ